MNIGETVAQDIKIYEELGNKFNNSLLFKAIALGVFTQGYLHLKDAIHEESLNITESEIEEFAEKALRVNNALKDYEQLMVDLSSELQENIFAFVELEGGDVLDNAFSNFLKNNLTFTYDELMNYFERRYSEKQLVKYIGNIPIYKRKMIFSEKEIKDRLEKLIQKGIVFCEEYHPKKGKKQPEFKGKMISMPIIYNIFAYPWYPILSMPEINNIGYEIRRVVYELLSVESDEGQIGKFLKLIFKESSETEGIQNLLGVLNMYYEQMGEPKPDFLVEENEEYKLSIGDTEVYERV